MFRYLYFIPSIIFFLFISSCNHSPNPSSKQQLTSKYIAAVKTDSGYYFRSELDYTPLYDNKMWDYAENFNNGWAVVGKKNANRMYYGIINLNGDSITGFISSFKPWPLKNKMVVIGKGLYMGIIDSTGKFIIQPIHTKILPFSNSLIKINNGKNYYSQDVDWGLLNLNGDTILPLVYKNIKWLTDSRAQVSIEKEVYNEYGYTDKTKLWGYIDSLGKVIIEPQYEETYQFVEGIAPVVKNDKVGFINKDGATVIDFVYNDFKYTYLKSADPKDIVSEMYADHSNDASVEYLINKKYLMLSKNKKWGFIDLGSNIIVPFKYDKIQMPDQTKVKISIGDKEGYYDLEMKKEIVPCKYDKVNPYTYKNPYLYKFKLKDKEGYIDSTGAEFFEKGI